MPEDEQHRKVRKSKPAKSKTPKVDSGREILRYFVKPPPETTKVEVVYPPEPKFEDHKVVKVKVVHPPEPKPEDYKLEVVKVVDGLKPKLEN